MIGRFSGLTGPAEFLPRTVATLMATTVLAGLPAVAFAQGAPAPAAAPAPMVPRGETISQVNIVGAQRLEPETIRSYIRLRVGDTYSQALADQALKDLYATELFSDVQVRNSGGVVTIEVKENPVINRIILEG